MNATSTHLPGSLLSQATFRFCFHHQDMRPREGGCEVRTDRWLCASCWLKQHRSLFSSKAARRSRS